MGIIIRSSFCAILIEISGWISSLIIPDKNSKINIYKSAKNIPNIKIIDEDGANIYDLLKYKNVIFTFSSIKRVQERLSKWENLIF